MTGGGGGGGYSRGGVVPSGGDSTGSGGSFGGGSSQTECSDILFQVVLSGPVPAVVKQLNVGDCLSVALESVGGEDVAVAKHKGKVAGIIPSSQEEALLYCLKKKKKFRATVISINGGMCTVLVESGSCP